MSSRPNRPVEDYPIVPPEELPPVPPVLPSSTLDQGMSAAADAPSAPAELVADLDFVAPRVTLVPVARAFRLGEEIVSEIRVHALSLHDLETLSQQRALGNLYVVYAAMCRTGGGQSITASILRGMEADDGQAVVEAAYDFLPRLARMAHGLPSA